MTSIWFEGFGNIDCDMQKIRDSLYSLCEHFVDVVSLMPGMTEVIKIEEGSDFVIIKTNEGLMKRTKIFTKIEANTTILEFDEEYKAGKKMAATSHYRSEFSANGSGITHRLVISNVNFPGILGFIYRKFASRNIGNAVLKSYTTFFEGL